MFEEEKTFILRFNLVAEFPEDYEGDDDGYAWLHDWETRIKPESRLRLRPCEPILPGPCTCAIGEWRRRMKWKLP